MSEVEVTIKLPASLVQRAKAAGLAVEQRVEVLIEALEADLRRQEAGRSLAEIAEDLRALPDHMKPTPHEIADEIRAHWAEQA
ncbi:MAG: hypothetical protein H7Y11_07975 [Armatimonadetes bacterium]|nr:hypothetical protein [Anaerolineae bacterium]